MVEIKFKALRSGVKLPTYATPGSAGADLYALEEQTISSGETALVKLGFAVAIPQGFEIQVRSRSGLALKNGVMVLNSPGTVDSDYRGEMGVILANFGHRDFVILPGDRVAQMVVNAVETAQFSVVDDLDKTTRGEGGFGSSGVRS